MKTAIEILSYQVNQAQVDIERQKSKINEANENIGEANKEIERLHARKADLEIAKATLQSAESLGVKTMLIGMGYTEEEQPRASSGKVFGQNNVVAQNNTEDNSNDKLQRAKAMVAEIQHLLSSPELSFL